MDCLWTVCFLKFVGVETHRASERHQKSPPTWIHTSICLRMLVLQGIHRYWTSFPLVFWFLQGIYHYLVTT